MAKNLVIVESPTKTKTLKKFLGANYDVAATMGHIVDLPSSRLGVDVENDFRPEYEQIEGKEKVIKTLKEAAKKADVIYLAPDPDREGEAIAWHVAGILKGSKAKLRRATFNEITKSAVIEALKNAGSIDQNKVDAQQARRVLDRLVGYQISPFLWKTVCRGLSAGRVQSVALRLVCEREAEIRAFVPQEYWSIGVELYKKGDKAKASFTAVVAERDGEKLDILEGATARRIEAELREADYSVAAVKTTDRKRQPYPPYVTSTLQQDAAARIRFSPKKTMSVAQALYEGVEVGDKGAVGLITYMRTDSTRVAQEAQQAAREFIVSEYGKDYCPETPPVYTSKKRTQDAHEAIRPTYFDLPPATVKKYLSADQLKLYTLIWNRFVASQMAPAEIERTSVDITAAVADPKSKKGHRYTLKTGAEKVVFPGFLKVYEDVAEENGNGNGNGKKVVALPKLAEHDPLVMVDVLPEQHWTKPPARYTEASLVKELEANGIGRPSTYAQIISTILARNYVKLEERRLYPTGLGETVNAILVDAFPEMFNVEFTAEMELELDRIEEGTETWTEIMHAFYGPLSGSLAHASERVAEIKQSHREVLPDPCPECGSQLIVRWSRSGKFIACSAYPKCRYTSDPDRKEAAAAEPTDQVCEKCGAPMVIKSGRFGRFLACSAYPTCKNTKPIPTGVKCPEDGCNGELVPRRTRFGRPFYSCSNYPNCKYAVWDRPVPRECPQCHSPFMLAKSTKAKGEHFLCPVCKHVVMAETAVEQPEPVEA
ncbi:MAG TPA: type I DNA topoisomerase [bacterium]|nr:type I DNA topoisomerase [bacterium]